MLTLRSRVEPTVVLVTLNLDPSTAHDQCCDISKADAPRAWHAQEHPDSLQTVLDIVVAHQGAPAAARLVGRLLTALVEPSPEAFRPLLRRIAILESAPLPLCYPSLILCCLIPHAVLHQINVQFTRCLM